MTDVTNSPNTPLEKPTRVELSLGIPEGKLLSAQKLLTTFKSAFGIGGAVLLFGAFIGWCFAYYHGSGVDAVIGAVFLSIIFFGTLKVFERLGKKDRGE